MNYGFVAIIFAVVAYLAYKASESAVSSAIAYILISTILRFDRTIPLRHIYADAEVEDGRYHHHVIPIRLSVEDDTAVEVRVTFHVVTCGTSDAEAIIFFHDIFESWKIWQPVMKRVCNTHYAVAIDLESHGQSSSLLSSQSFSQIKDRSHRQRLRARLYMQLIDELGLKECNLIVAGELAATITLPLLVNHSDVHRILRYGKLQSTGNMILRSYVRPLTCYLAQLVWMTLNETCCVSMQEIQGMKLIRNGWKSFAD
jgi:pimeloyl-ACP methyl ester carboxylesterase